MGPFIKDVINRGGRGFAKRWSYLISLFSKNDDEGGGQGGSKISKNWWRLLWTAPKVKEYHENPYIVTSNWNEYFSCSISVLLSDIFQFVFKAKSNLFFQSPIQFDSIPYEWDAMLTFHE